MLITFILLILACGYFCWLNYKLGGGALVTLGFKNALMFAVKITLIIVFFATVTGQIQAHYSKKPGHFGEMVAGKSVPKAVAAGILAPGGLTLGTVLQTEWRDGGNRLSIIGCLIGMSMLSWTTLMFRISFLGPRLTIVLLIIGLIVTSVSVGVLMIVQRLHLFRL